MVDVAMAKRRLTSFKLLLLLAMVLPIYVKLSVVVTGCVPMNYQRLIIIDKCKMAASKMAAWNLRWL